MKDNMYGRSPLIFFTEGGLFNWHGVVLQHLFIQLSLDLLLVDWLFGGQVLIGVTNLQLS